METASKINSLVLLRAIAVLGVCFGHLGYALAYGNSLSPLFMALHNYGKYGVHMFFVISGFIIPLSMDKAGYDIKYFFKFLAKRGVRLHPPYLIAFILAIIILAAEVQVKRIPFPHSFGAVLEYCLYWKRMDTNPVFWTLKVEAEFYLLMALYFPLLKRCPKLTLGISIPIILLLSAVVPPMPFELPDYLIFFWVGVVGFVVYTKAEGAKWPLVCHAILIGCMVLFYPFPAAIAAIFTIAIILFYKGRGNRVFNNVGEMSYSVYLMHYPIGVKLINLIYPHINPAYAVLLFLLANIVVIVACALFWKWVEKPFASLSNKIKYGDAKHAPKNLT